MVTDAELYRYINRLVAGHARRMRNMVQRGTVSMVDDGPKMQTNQVALLDGELIEGAERVQQYGFSSHPQNDAECFVVFCGAEHAHPLIFTVDDRRYRVKGTKQGEVVIYTDEGDSILFGRENTITVTTKHFVVKAEEDIVMETKKFELKAETSIEMRSPLTTIKTDTLTMQGKDGGDAASTLQGSLTASNDLQANDGGVSLRAHVHQDVQTGPSTTGTPVGG
ncbi:MAG: phage baseplate assembly protein V [Desulfovibrio sp.]|jgi:phage baseplate assembly protein V|nr:phage baseplate assembly protein V [Desulfovibrio sp.]